MNKRLFRSRHESVVSGVCGGIAEYFGVDPSIIRIAVVVLTLATGGLGIVAYLICALVIPLRPIGETPTSGFNQVDKDNMYSGQGNGNKVVGGVLIVVGSIFLAKKLLWWVDFWMVAPVICILVGIMIIYKGKERKQ